MAWHQPSAEILLIGPLGKNFNEILIQTGIFSFKNIHFKMPLGKWQPFCTGLNVLFIWCSWHGINICLCGMMYHLLYIWMMKALAFIQSGSYRKHFHKSWRSLTNFHLILWKKCFSWSRCCRQLNDFDLVLPYCGMFSGLCTKCLFCIFEHMALVQICTWFAHIWSVGLWHSISRVSVSQGIYWICVYWIQGLNLILSGSTND